MVDGPDLAGFAAAQARLREYTGETVVFYMPTGEEWPEGTQLDPQSGRPYDPLIEPVASGFSSTELKCNLASRPTAGSLDEDVDVTPIGNMELGDILAIMSVAEGATVSGATEFDAKGDHFQITRRKDDGIGGEYRHLIWGKRTGDSWG